MEGICSNCGETLLFSEIEIQQCYSCKEIAKENKTNNFMVEWNSGRVKDEDAPMLKTPAHPIVAEVLAERKRQDDKWGEQNHSPIEWLAILGEEVGEANKHGLQAHFRHFGEDEENEIEQLKEYRTELVQVAAVAISMIESLDRNELQEE